METGRKLEAPVHADHTCEQPRRSAGEKNPGETDLTSRLLFFSVKVGHFVLIGFSGPVLFDVLSRSMLEIDSKSPPHSPHNKKVEERHRPRQSIPLVVPSTPDQTVWSGNQRANIEPRLSLVGKLVWLIADDEGAEL